MFTKNKSPETSFYSNDEVLESLMRKLTIIQTEMRAQRQDLSTIKRQLHTLINASKMQKEVDDFYDDKPPEEVAHDSTIDSD